MTRLSSNELALEMGQALEGQHPARTTRHALAARQAVPVVNRQTAPCVGAHINVDGAVIRTDAALHAACGVGHDQSLRQSGVPVHGGFNSIFHGDLRLCDDFDIARQEFAWAIGIGLAIAIAIKAIGQCFVRSNVEF